MSFDNNSTYSDDNKSTSSEIKKQTPPNNTSKEIKPYNSEGFKNISNINDFLINLEKNPKIGDIPKNTEDRIRELAKNPQIFGAFKIKIQAFSSVMNVQMLEKKLTEYEAKNTKIKTVDEKKKTDDETDKTVDENTNAITKNENVIEDATNNANSTNSELENQKKIRDTEVEKQVKIKEEMERFKKVENLSSILRGTSGAEAFLRKVDVLRNTKDFTQKGVDDALNSLRNPKDLRQIATSLKAESPAKYQTFRKAVSFDPQIAMMLDSFEAKSNGVSWKAIVDIHAGVSGVKWVVDGDKVSFESGGATVESDKGKTTIALNGSDYKMSSKPWEVNENLEKAKKVQEENNKKNRLVG